MFVLGENTYIEVVDADNYFTTNLNNATWLALSEEVKQQYLVTATRYVDTAASYRSERLDMLQLLEFPRVEWPEIPTDIKYATCEVAIEMLLQGKSSLTTAENALDSLSVGSISLDFVESTSTDWTIFNTLARRYILRYGYSSFNSSSTAVYAVKAVR